MLLLQSTRGDVPANQRRLVRIPMGKLHWALALLRRSDLTSQRVFFFFFLHFSSEHQLVKGKEHWLYKCHSQREGNELGHKWSLNNTETKYTQNYTCLLFFLPLCTCECIFWSPFCSIKSTHNGAIFSKRNKAKNMFSYVFLLKHLLFFITFRTTRFDASLETKAACAPTHPLRPTHSAV